MSSTTQETTLLQHVHQGCVMGIESIRHLASLSEDSAFSSALVSQLAEYEEVKAEAASLLTAAGQEPQGISSAAKFMSDMMSNMKSMTDHSPSRLAQIMIEGSTMGTTNLTKQMNHCTDSGRKATSLAEKLLRTEEGNIEQMKKFL